MKHKTHPNRRAILSLTLALGAMILPLAAGEKEKAIEVPEDFSLSISMPSVGVVPETEHFMKIAPRVKQGEKTGFAIDWGHGTAGKNKAANYLHGRDLSDAEVIGIYQLVLKMGFFEKKDRYAPKDVEFGGTMTTVSITANGKTKEVFIASGAKVPEIETLIAAVLRYTVRVARM